MSLVGCSKGGSSDDNKIVVGASPTPHAEILEVIKPQLEKEGYNLEIKELNPEQLPTVLKDVDASIINTNYAISVNLNPSKDAIVIE